MVSSNVDDGMRVELFVEVASTSSGLDACENWIDCRSVDGRKVDLRD